jgi:DNA repair exonuclease SbcCD nuclease subunit
VKTRNFVLCILLVVCWNLAALAQVRLAHLSDLHIGLARAPQAAENLRRAVDIINQRGVDAVLVSGDIGEKPSDWEKAREILSHCKAKVYYVPGNHDIHSTDFDRYRHVFGDDWYRVQIKNVVLYALDSEVFGNYDSYEEAKSSLPPASDEARENKARMLRWLEESAEKEPGHGKDHNHGKDKDKDQDRDNGLIVIGMQHIPIARDGNMPKDGRPYWFIPEGDRKPECELLKRLGIRHMLVGHWHHRDVFEFDGITWHVGAATSWPTFGGELGFDIDTIQPNGEFKSEFISLEH